MSTAQFTCPLIVTVPGQVIASSLWNNEFVNLFDNINPDGVGAYSDTDTQMQTATDPFPSGATSRPTAVSGEIERLRYMLQLIIGQTYWYQHPSTDLETASSDITTLQGKFPVQTADIGDLQVTDAKINDVAFGKITGTITPSDGTITTSKIVDAAVTDAKINDVAASKITGQIVTSQITDSNVTAAKLASDVPIAVGLKSIQTVNASTVTISSGASTGNSNTIISSVNTAKVALCVVSLTIASDATSNHPVPMVQVALTTSTNLKVTLTTSANASGGAIQYNVTVTILEFN